MTLKQRLQEIWQRRSNGRFEVIDGLRALSVLWMINFHSLFTLGFFLTRDQFLALSSHWLLMPFVQGHLGVDVFFTISGFLIGHILFTEFKTTQRLDVRTFYLRRALRLLPVYLVVLAIFALLNPVNVHNAWANVLYLNNYLGIEEQFMVWTWSLAIEGQFYLVFPVIVLLTCRHAKRPLIVFGVLFVLSFVARYLSIRTNGIGLPAPLHEVVDQPAFFRIFDSLYDKTAMRYGGLLVGVIAAWLVVFTPIVSRLGRHPQINLGILIGGFLLVIITTAISPFADSSTIETFGTIYLVSHRNALSLGIAMIILYCLTDKGRQSWTHRFLASPVWFPISQLSYSAYLIHVIVIYAGYQFFLPEKMDLPHLLAFLSAFLIATFSLSAVLFVTIERPCLRWRKSTGRAGEVK